MNRLMVVHLLVIQENFNHVIGGSRKNLHAHQKGPGVARTRTVLGRASVAYTVVHVVAIVQHQYLHTKVT